MSTGDKISYPWQASSKSAVAPYLGLYTDYRFSTANALPVGIPYVGIVNGWSERVTAGATITRGRNGPSLSLGGELGGSAPATSSGRRTRGLTGRSDGSA